MNCIAIKANGEHCTHRGINFEGYCGTHFNSKMKSDRTYAARYRAHDERGYNAFMERAAQPRVDRPAAFDFAEWHTNLFAAQQAILAAEQARLPAAAAPAVVRDPVGGVDLRAFAGDGQNIHRESVQTATHRTIAAIIAKPLAADQDTLAEVIKSFVDVIKWGNISSREKMIATVSNDYATVGAFDTKYSTVLDHVWAFIRSHKEYKELCLRLAEEIKGGIGMCSNGKMCRLVNVLQGFDETLEPEPPRELFQTRIGTLMSRPLAEREAAARALFVEFKIPEKEHSVWLEPLLDE